MSGDMPQRQLQTEHHVRREHIPRGDGLLITITYAMLIAAYMRYRPQLLAAGWQLLTSDEEVVERLSNKAALARSD